MAVEIVLFGFERSSGMVCVMQGSLFTVCITLNFVSLMS